MLLANGFHYRVLQDKKWSLAEGSLNEDILRSTMTHGYAREVCNESRNSHNQLPYALI